MILVPSRVVSIPEGFAAFSCRHPSEEITSIQWLLNGSAIQVDGHIGLLHLRELTEEYNSTTIQCRVSVSSGENFTSNTALLLIQGARIISIVQNHHKAVFKKTSSRPSTTSNQHGNFIDKHHLHLC